MIAARIALQTAQLDDLIDLNQLENSEYQNEKNTISVDEKSVCQYRKLLYRKEEKHSKGNGENSGSCIYILTFRRKRKNRGRWSRGWHFVEDLAGLNQSATMPLPAETFDIRISIRDVDRWL